MRDAAVTIQRAFRLRRSGTKEAKEPPRGSGAGPGECPGPALGDGPRGDEDASGEAAAAGGGFDVPDDDAPAGPASAPGVAGPIEIKVCVVPFNAGDFARGSNVVVDAVGQVVRGAANIVIPVGSPSAPRGAPPRFRDAAAGGTADANTQTDADPVPVQTAVAREGSAVGGDAARDREARRRNAAALKIQRAFRRRAGTAKLATAAGDDADREDRPPVADQRALVIVNDGTLEEPGAAVDVDAIIAQVDAGVEGGGRLLSVDDDDGRECAFLHVSDITYEECLRDMGSMDASPAQGSAPGQTRTGDAGGAIGGRGPDADRQDDGRGGPDSDAGGSRFGLAFEDGYEFISKAPPPTFGGDAATRNAIRNGEHARLMEEGDRGAPESDAELRSKLREFRLVHLKRDYVYARAAHRRAVDGVVDEVRAALNDVNASASALEDEVMGIRRMMRGFAPNVNRIIVEEAVAVP